MSMITSLEFKLLSPTMIKSLAATEITRPELYDSDGFPVENGVVDRRLGVIDPGMICMTCGQGMGNCFGHFGYTQLVQPVIHVLFVKVIYKILKNICASCSRYIGTSKKCGHCGEAQKITKLEKPYTFKVDDKSITQLEVREKLEKIPDEDLPSLEFSGGRPEWLILTVFPVPPVITRPSITLETGERSEDDLTHKLVDIIRINQRLRENMDIGAPEFIIDDLWELLQYHTATFFDNSLAGLPAARHRSGRPLKTLADRLKSKEGRFRQNLAGKRVNFSARTVISPDTHISINEVGVPLAVGREMTIPVSVQDHTINEIRTLIENVPNYPSVNYVIRPDGKKKKVTAENKEEILEELGPGYIVERHLQNGDVVLFNRQPSLHRMSIMAHKIRITPWKTFTLNTTVCPPYNADFDGDEMNMHVPQTDEARAEAELLMTVENHIRSPRFGGPIIGCEHDPISGNYLFTKPNTKINRQDAIRLLSGLGLYPELPSKKVFTGKEIFSYLLPKDLNIRFKSKVCGCDKCVAGTCPNDGYVVIENGVLKRGVIDKNAIGREAGRLLDKIDRDYGRDTVRKFVDRVSLIGIKWLDKVGFTMGLSDIDITDDIQKMMDKELAKGMSDSDNLIQSFHNKKLELLPGRTAEETLESKMLIMLSGVSDRIGRSISDNLEENGAVIMAKSGARGSLTHLAQLIGGVGQETVLGRRVYKGYYGRTLPHFPVGDLTPGSRGFVSHGFKSGLTPFEFFFDVLSGREGLMDKSLRTRHSGYLERRLMNALQDLKVEYDGTVRDNRKVIVQFTPGEDGIDPAKSDWGTIDVEGVVREV